MITKPIDALLNRVTWRCMICNEPAAVGCDCWVKLRCRGCGREKMTQRDQTDPEGGKPETLYFNKHGRQWYGDKWR